MFVGPALFTGPSVFIGRSATDGRHLGGAYDVIHRKRRGWQCAARRFPNRNKLSALLGTNGNSQALAPCGQSSA
jgi:hypothetical protein